MRGGRVMKAVLLAGGFGTRLAEYTDRIPKPMVEIGGRPMLWHIMKIYSHYGINDFIIALGYKGDYVKEYFLNYFNKKSDFSIDLSSGVVTNFHNESLNWKVTLVDTGLESMTGGRLKRLENYIDGTFMLTYGDGVADIDLNALTQFHLKHGGLATITAVHPTSRYGKVVFGEDNLVTKFEEKPEFGDDWINAGFMVLEPKFLNYINGDDEILERGPMIKACAEKKLHAYKHSGFWKCMDTLRDCQELEAMWSSGLPPWKLWE
jgi:glucose-1-phosphate cytidylyltransferase